MRIRSLALSMAAFCLASGTLLAQSNSPSGNYFWSTLGVGGEGPDAFVDRGAGNDLLPYTADDVALPVGGNFGGTWSLAHFDNDSDGAIQDEEHIFTITRRLDDDDHEFSALNRPEYGVLYESEDWNDYHDARNQGPSAAVPMDPIEAWLSASGNDFEHNDDNGWCDESNAYLYNNARANQHGEGESRYYFENISPSNTDALPARGWVYDEAEGFEKTFNFQNNYNDPNTPEDERGCRRWQRTTKQVIKGYLIPVADLAGLENGSLKTLFGWETVDLAQYFRETIAPKLADGDLNIFPVDAGESNYDPVLTLPPTHIMLYQLELPVSPNGAGCGGDDDLARATALGLWNVPAEGATYRVSHILGFNADAHNEATVGLHRPWTDIPEDDAQKNVWLLDHFFRADTSHLGKYTTAGPAETVWTIADDPELSSLDNTKDRILTSSGPGTVIAPLPRPLGANERPIDLVVDLADNEEGDGLTKLQIGLHSATGVIGYAELEPAKATLALGGTLDTATGLISTPTLTASANASVLLGGYNVTAGTSEYTRFLVRVASDKIQIGQYADGDYVQNDFIDLGAGITPLVEIAVGGGGGGDAAVSSVSVYGSASFAITTLAVFAAFPSEAPTGTFIRADSNCDGTLDISDAINTLNVLFLGTGSICCPEASNANGDATTDLSDAVYSLAFSFQGGAPPPAPYPECGGSGCEAHPGCP